MALINKKKYINFINSLYNEKMFWQDVPMILWWWLVWFFLGCLGFNLIRGIFDNWDDGGYIFGKIVGTITVSLMVWILGIAKVIPFGLFSILITLIIIMVIGWRINKGSKVNIKWHAIYIEELIFLLLLLIWSFVKGHQADISGLEKFMDFGFMKSILESRYFPPADMWFSGKPINYYYFGHLYTAVVTKLSGINLIYSFNLMLATLFSLMGVMSGSIMFQLLKGFNLRLRIFGAVIVSYILLLGGNLHTIYSWTRGYTGDNPPPFWQIWGTVPGTYWYPNATRFIPYTIHEFPAYSFVVSDIHGHVLGIPIVLSLIALLILLFGEDNQRLRNFKLIGFGLGLGCAFMTNALDGLIYLGLFLILTLVEKWKFIKENYKHVLKEIGLVMITFVIIVLPFLLTFKSFVNGVAVNCPPEVLANSRFGPIVFEETSKCQKSPIWMMLILWGFFLYGGIWLYMQKNNRSNLEKGLLWISLYCLGLVIFPEFFYFRDIYPMHFRSNTMFKLGYQVFILMSLVTVYAFIKAWQNKKKQMLGILAILPLIYLVVIYPSFSIEGYFGKIRFDNYIGLNGVTWIKRNYPDNYALLNWMTNNILRGSQPVILEANGDSYTDYNMFSAFSGNPTVAGWTVHEWLWREGYSPIAARSEEVRQFYEGDDINIALAFLKKYKVKFVVVSNFEREKYKNLNLNQILSTSKLVFKSTTANLYQVN